MAERRMFTKKITDSDAFLDMPLSAQALYFHINMAADDEGFVNNPKKIQRMIGASEDDLKLLIMKNFLITYDTGVIVVKHWKMHNYIQKDRFHPTVYQEERQMLKVKENGAYTLDENGLYTECIQDVSRMDTEVRLGKDRLGKVSQGKDRLGKDKETRHKYGEYAHVLLTDAQYQRLCEDFGDIEVGEMIRILDEAIQAKGYKYKDFNLVLRGWVRKEYEKRHSETKDKFTSEWEEVQ